MTARRLYWQAMAIATAAVALPLYAAAETVSALRDRSAAGPLDAMLDRLDDRLDRIEHQLIVTGSTDFMDRLTGQLDRITGAYDELLTRIAARRASRPARDRHKQ
jgi:hypothetical protein